MTIILIKIVIHMAFNVPPEVQRNCVFRRTRVAREMAERIEKKGGSH